jgi:hypothetical protein
MSIHKFCVKCGKSATYDSPNDLCDEHWIDWWIEGMKEQGFTTEQIAEYRKEIEETVKSNYKPD